MIVKQIWYQNDGDLQDLSYYLDKLHHAAINLRRVVVSRNLADARVELLRVDNLSLRRSRTSDWL